MRYMTSIKLNILGILAIVMILTSAYVIEFAYHDLPCPLCLLQRLGFLTTSFGFLLNLRFGNKMQHYGLSLLGAIFTGAIAVRQILLHIEAGTGGYGPTLFSLHLYTWSFVIVVMMILFITFALILEPPQYGIGERPTWIKHFVTAVFILVLLFTLANAITAFLICGFNTCPHDPVKYLFFS